ncbi:MAG: SIMPL domain-containing protein [Bacillota bacterium]|nr:SIMPL domain-containing protein [Bacillota bacterium]
MNYNFYPCMQRTERTGHLRINGLGTIKASPDIATVYIGVITEDKNLQTAQEENAIKSTSVINGLYRMNIPKQDISTAAYTIEPQYNYIDGKQEFRGYRVSNTLNVKIRDLSKVGAIIDDAVANGANNISNINFTVENPEVYYNNALKLALKDSIEKAKAITNTLGVSLNEVPLRILELSTVPSAESTSLQKAYSATTPILPGEISIIARIETIFNYK